MTENSRGDPGHNPCRLAVLGADRLRAFAGIQNGELASVTASFVMFFSVLSAYYIIRPVRDELGVTLGSASLQSTFQTVFLVMLAAVPVFGWIATRFPRRVVLPAIYVFSVLNLIAFWVAFRLDPGNRSIAQIFFVWASVFNLFVVSLFWSLMSELWTEGQAKRLYGFIAAGGTAGALAGPALAQVLARLTDPMNLLLVSAVLLAIATVASLSARRSIADLEGASDLRPKAKAVDAKQPGLLDGAIDVLKTPYLLRIAIFVFLANVVGTFFYLEQSRLVANAFATSAERVQFFSSRDLAVSVLTLVIQIFGTARVMQRFGITAALLALPAVAILGTLALMQAPLLTVVAAVMVGERVAAFALSSPALKVMYTLATDDQKYRAQNFVDTVVYRGGDAVSGALYNFVSAGAGFAAPVTSAAALILSVIWIGTAVALGRMHKIK